MQTHYKIVCVFAEMSAFCKEKCPDFAEIGRFTLLLYFKSVPLGNIASWYQ